MIAEFFLITDNLARYNGKLNLTSRNTSNYSILKILEFESISNVPFINLNLKFFRIGFFFFFSLEKILARVKSLVDWKINSTNFYHI